MTVMPAQGWHLSAPGEAARDGWTHLVTNKPDGVLYVGVTLRPCARMVQHRAGAGSSFCGRYGLSAS